jgi:hypothetical protein
MYDGDLSHLTLTHSVENHFAVLYIFVCDIPLCVHITFLYIF